VATTQSVSRATAASASDGKDNAPDVYCSSFSWVNLTTRPAKPARSEAKCCYTMPGWPSARIMGNSVRPQLNNSGRALPRTSGVGSVSTVSMNIWPPLR